MAGGETQQFPFGFKTEIVWPRLSVNHSLAANRWETPSLAISWGWSRRIYAIRGRFKLTLHCGAVGAETDPLRAGFELSFQSLYTCTCSAALLYVNTIQAFNVFLATFVFYTFAFHCTQLYAIPFTIHGAGYTVYICPVYIRADSNFSEASWPV